MLLQRVDGRSGCFQSGRAVRVVLEERLPCQLRSSCVAQQKVDYHHSITHLCCCILPTDKNPVPFLRPKAGAKFAADLFNAAGAAP